MYESDCHGIEMIKDPTGKEWAIGGTSRPERWTHDPWCGLPITPKKTEGGELRSAREAEDELEEIREQLKGASMRPDLTGVSIIDDIKDLQRDCNRMAAKLTRLERVVEAARKGLKDVVMHLEGSICECGEELKDIDAAFSAREAIEKMTALDTDGGGV